MAHKTNSFGRFWKELKRRKVIHVITVYAATAKNGALDHFSPVQTDHPRPELIL